jgi:hypothetical protein
MLNYVKPSRRGLPGCMKLADARLSNDGAVSELHAKVGLSRAAAVLLKFQPLHTRFAKILFPKNCIDYWVTF